MSNTDFGEGCILRFDTTFVSVAAVVEVVVVVVVVVVVEVVVVVVVEVVVNGLDVVVEGVNVGTSEIFGMSLITVVWTFSTMSPLQHSDKNHLRKRKMESNTYTFTIGIISLLPDKAIFNKLSIVFTTITARERLFGNPRGVRKI